ncbi:putative 2EXR domain-containing protein [Seiridium unicorne]|uniref:2EXR domain-containing protein n=1 Tax=Seiridium unicorne TaxID=138068 RepID=A0ABR2UFL1_9PEZI
MATFHHFRRLPKELGDQTWDAAVRNERPGAHVFSLEYDDAFSIDETLLDTKQAYLLQAIRRLPRPASPPESRARILRWFPRPLQPQRESENFMSGTGAFHNVYCAPNGVEEYTPLHRYRILPHQDLIILQPCYGLTIGTSWDNVFDRDDAFFGEDPSINDVPQWLWSVGLMGPENIAIEVAHPSTEAMAVCTELFYRLTGLTNVWMIDYRLNRRHKSTAPSEGLLYFGSQEERTVFYASDRKSTGARVQDVDEYGVVDNPNMNHRDSLIDEILERQRDRPYQVQLLACEWNSDRPSF